MSTTITRKYIKRITKREGNTSIRQSGGGGGGGGGVSQYWVDDNYVSKEFFNRLFEIHDENGDPILPNDVETEIDNIQAMFGFWTNAYLSALGNNPGGGGAELTLASLADVAVQGVTNGQALVWNAAQGKWVPGTGGIDLTAMWNALAANTNQQINATHITTALTGYATQSWVTQQGYLTASAISDMATKTWVNTQISDMATQTWVSTNYLSKTDATNTYLTKTEANTTYLSIAFFRALFRAYTSGGSEVVPNDGSTSTIDNIKAMFGFWTNSYLSALGSNPGGASLTLSSLSDVSISGATAGQVLTYRNGTWRNETPQGGGTDMQTVWQELAATGTQQINASHLTNALSNYNPTSNFKTVNGNSIIGTGNITIESSGGTVTAVKVGTTSYSPTDGVVSLPAYPTKVSQFTNDSGYITSSGSCASATEATRFAYISNWNSPKGGANVINLMTCGSPAADGAPTYYTSGISIVTSYVGFQLASYGGGGEALYFRKLEDNGTWHSWYEVITGANIGSQSVNYATSAGNASTADLANMIKNNITVSSSSSVDNGIWFNNGTRNVLFGTSVSGNTGIWVDGIDWVVGVNSSGSIFLNGNATSATQLQTSRTIWGQSFDGTANVSGAITDATTITASSNVSVGGTLSVTGATTLSSTLSVSGNATLGGDILMNSGGRIHVKNEPSGASLYIGNSNDAGWVYMSDMCSRQGNGYWKILSNGNSEFANVYSRGYVTALSDIRHKDVMGDVGLTVSEVANAPAVKFLWKDRRQEGLQVGSIAQYWQKVLPEAIVEAADGELTMSYGVIALLASIANAREIVNLRREIAELKRKLQNHGILE